MLKIPVKIIELTSPSGKSAVDVMIDVYDYNQLENVQEKIQKFKKKYFEFVKKVQRLFYGENLDEKKKRQTLPSSLYYKIGELLQQFNNEIKNEFKITNYTEAISRDFGLSKDYHYDLSAIVQIFKQNQILDSIPFSYYRALKRKRFDLEKLDLFQQEIKRLNKMGKEDKLPGREIYKVELIDIIEKSNSVKK